MPKSDLPESDTSSKVAPLTNNRAASPLKSPLSQGTTASDKKSSGKKAPKSIRLEKTPRNVALEILSKFDRPFSQKQLSKKQAPQIKKVSHGPVQLTFKADELLNEALVTTAAHWSSADRHLLHQLVMGTLREWHPLTESLTALSHFPLAKIHPSVRTLLRLGMYQLAFLQRVPDYAVINETVRTAKALKVSDAAVRFVNGTLRSFQRQQQAQATAVQFNTEIGSTPSEEEIFAEVALGDKQLQEGLLSTPEAFSRYSGWPLWLVQRWWTAFSVAELQSMASVWKQPAPLACRVNTYLKSPQAYCELLSSLNIVYECPFPDILPECLLLPEWRGTPTQLPGFEEGWVFVQDISSAQVTAVLSPQAGERILDACAAPGSKTTHMAQRMLMENSEEPGSIVALDTKPERLKRLTSNCIRLRLPENLVTTVCSSLESYADTAPEPFDRILVDAPCSGLGTIRRHPEILIQLTEPDLKQFHRQQMLLLRTAALLLKPGGTLLFSVCSMDPAETRDVIRVALTTLPEMTFLKDALIPLTASQDGFYWALLARVNTNSGK
jgi:16S rRNA (cytosine967-C5)-methyltransferase